MLRAHESDAGSDAASIPDFGIVCWGEHEGKRVLGLRVTWDKRYITLGPVATLLGLAFRAYDPDHLVGDTEDLGITCALIPTTHPGVQHRPPAHAAERGVPERPELGHATSSFRWTGSSADSRCSASGWRMLMECLAAGRGISLPSSSTGMAKLAVRAAGGYARVRTQFKTPIGRFEGVEEALDADGRQPVHDGRDAELTATAVDLGEKPAVLSAIAKLHITERARQVVNDGWTSSAARASAWGRRISSAPPTCRCRLRSPSKARTS